MSKIDKIQHSIHLLSKAIVATGQAGSDQLVHAARSDMKKALQKLEEAGKHKMKKIRQNDTNAARWWNNVVAHAPMANLSPEAAMRSLKILDEMISKEKQVLDELEKKVQYNIAQPADDPTVLSD